MAESDLTIFCRQVRARSKENRRAITLLSGSKLTGSVIGILRQELDSMVRCMFLLSISEPQYREQLLHNSVNGRQWRTKDGKRKVTDKEMVELSCQLHGWTQNVYAFGCAFIHLSSFHDYAHRDPFDSIDIEDRRRIGHYLRHYHGVIIDNRTKLRDIETVLPAVFEKISANLECCIRDLEIGSGRRVPS